MKKLTEQELTLEEEKTFRKISEYLFKREYPSIGLDAKFFTEFGTQEATCKALAILQSGKMINVIYKKPIMLSYIQLLDPDGNEIPNEMIDTYPNSDTCFIWFKEYRSEDIPRCHDHLERCVNEKIPYVKDCPKCIEEWGSHRCLVHNQSLLFCKKCMEQSKKLRALICNEMPFEEMEKLVIKEHKKDLLKRRGF